MQCKTRGRVLFRYFINGAAVKHEVPISSDRKIVPVRGGPRIGGIFKTVSLERRVERQLRPVFNSFLIYKGDSLAQPVNARF